MFDFNHKQDAGYLCNKFIQEAHLKSDGANLFRFVNNHYQMLAPDTIQTELIRYISPNTRMNLMPNRLDQIIKTLIREPSIQIDTVICDSGKIVFLNGIYDTDTDRLYGFDEEYRWAVVNANYIRDVSIEDAPTFLDFVETSLDYGVNPEKTEFLLEIIGYCLSDYTSAKLAFFFVGEPSSGKSKILEFLQRLLEDYEVSQISLPFISSRFNIGQLYGKRLNICTELPANQFPSIEIFKALTACDRVYGELKFKDGFSFRPRLKLLNAGNSVPLPKEADGTCSIADRMAILMFDHSIDRENWNICLVDELLAEKDVICSLAVNRLKKLVESNFTFTVPQDSRIFLSGYKDALNAFPIFISEECIRGETKRVSSLGLWEAYKEFCNSNSYPIGISKQIFTQKVAVLDGVQKKRIREEGKQITAFMGICNRNMMDELNDKTDQDWVLSDTDKGGVEKGCTPCTTAQKKLNGGGTKDESESGVPRGRGTVQIR